jgi:hypothetical protein
MKRPQLIAPKDAQALVLVLSLAENHPMWTERRGNPQEFKDEVYEAIQTVREYLKRNGVRTAYEALQQAARQSDGLTKEGDNG